mmetsp:Transcript_12886/g.19593  ORF Transcript_12886/g.19593 Transcript_12886/m.19593 type:complete len:104 (-) Transcript_12886:1261-1572(-)
MRWHIYFTAGTEVGELPKEPIPESIDAAERLNFPKGGSPTDDDFFPPTSAWFIQFANRLPDSQAPSIEGSRSQSPQAPTPKSSSNTKPGVSDHVLRGTAAPQS